MNPPVVEIQLTEEQLLAVTKIKAWLEDKASKQEFKMGGYAGTGKTTVIKYILKAFKDTDTAVAAFTGKAVNVLQRKGVNAQTLHSLIYDTELVDKKLVFHRKSKFDVKHDLIIVDEASMISTELYDDLKSFGIKLLFVGDPGQLEPVGDNPNLMMLPDYTLSKIHRQAEKSPIIYWANEIRQGRGLQHKSDTAELVIRNKAISTGMFNQFDQFIVAKNKTREDMNAKIRMAKQLEPQTLQIGEKIIVLRNNLNAGVFNGMILFVRSMEEGYVGKYTKHAVWHCNCEDETGKKYNDVPIWRTPFLAPAMITKDTFIPKEVVHATYGYVITCHKSQGSEWARLLVFDEYMPPHIWDMKRWRYTAITRASQHLTYCM